MKVPIIVLCFLMVTVQVADNANILFVTQFPSTSHQSVFRPIWKELSLRGHHVTAITAKPFNDKTLTNLTEIDTSSAYKMKRTIPKRVMQYFMEKPDFLQVFIKDIVLTYLFSSTIDEMLQTPEVLQLINSDQKFDAVIAEWLFPTMGAFAAKFNCPLIGVTSLGAPIVSLDTVGNPSHPISAPDHNLPVGRHLSLRERMLSALYSVYVRLHYHLVVLPREDRTVKKYFGANMPYIGDIERSISLLLLNRNPIMHKIMPVVPAVIELGRVRSNTTAPPINAELKNFLDKSTNGVVYFSLGSGALTSELDEKIINIFLRTFEKLPYNVVWKWEKDVLPGQPKNVFIQKWTPQWSLLGHPNTKLFITQGGLQSLEETISNHVPIIGLPTHSDQTMNVDTAVTYGFGIAIDFDELNEEILTKSIHTIMKNSSYTENVAKVERLMNDLPSDGLDRAIWWIEYVLRHKGAKHLRSPALDLPFYQYYLLDVISVVILVVSIAIYLQYKLISLILMRFRKKTDSKTKKE